MTMTDEERKKILDTNFPSVQSGNTRPTDGVPTDFPYSVDFPQFMAKDKVLYTLMNLVIRQTLSNDKALKELLESGDKTLKDLIDSLSNRLANNDLALVTEAVKGLMSPEDKKKLDGIANNANNYSHPNSGVIAGTYKQVAVNAQGHVTKGSNPTTLAGYGITDAASKNHGNHVPTLESANNSRFLRNDNTWQTVTPANIGAPTTSGSGATGTWSINITGKANTATKADTATLATTATKAVDSDTLDGYHYADIVPNLAVNYGKTTPTMTPLVDWDTMSTKFGYSPIRVDRTTKINGKTVTLNITACYNIKNDSRARYSYGGDTSGGGLYNGDIILKEDFRNYDKIAIWFTDDNANFNFLEIKETWEIEYMMQNVSLKFGLIGEANQRWEINGYYQRGTDSINCSTPTLWRCSDQNCGIVEIYGIKY